MSFADEFQDFLADEVTVEPFASRDAYGNVSYGAGATYKARVEGRTRVTRALDGSERVSTVQVYVLESAGFTPLDRITLPARFVPAQPPIIAVEKFGDEAGPTHEVVLC